MIGHSLGRMESRMKRSTPVLFMIDFSDKELRDAEAEGHRHRDHLVHQSWRELRPVCTSEVPL